MTTSTTTDLTRRSFGGLALAASAVAVLPRAAAALSPAQASALIQQVVGEINGIINSGRSEGQMYASFQGVFTRYADMSFIAFRTLGPPARSATQAQMNAYATAFSGYMARKYGKRFREFIGGSVDVIQARAVQNWVEVETQTTLRGRSPFEVIFFVSDRSGRSVFFDMRVQGISLLNSEAEEVRALYDQNGRTVEGVIQALNRAG